MRYNNFGGLSFASPLCSFVLHAPSATPAKPHRDPHRDPHRISKSSRLVRRRIGLAFALGRRLRAAVDVRARAHEDAPSNGQRSRREEAAPVFIYHGVLFEVVIIPFKR